MSSMRSGSVFRLSGLVVAAAEALLGALLASTVLGPYFWVTAAATAALAVAVPRLMNAPPEGPEGGGGEEDPDDPPPWWPQFEQALRAYERDRLETRV